MKIAVIGYSGAGKSTLARELGRRYGCPVLHLDQVQFTAGWAERDRGEALARVEKFMELDDWIIDGNYGAFYQERRLAEADRILFLNFGRWDCLFRVLRRARRFRGRTRPDMAGGCTEKLDWAFVRWVLWEGRTSDRRRHYRRIAEAWPEKIVVLRNQRQLDRYWEGTPC